MLVNNFCPYGCEICCGFSWSPGYNSLYIWSAHHFFCAACFLKFQHLMLVLVTVYGIPARNRCYHQPCAIVYNPTVEGEEACACGNDSHQDLLSPSWLLWSSSVIAREEEGGGTFPSPFLPHRRKPEWERPVLLGCLSVSLPCIHPATLQLTLLVGNHKSVIESE